MKKDELVKLSEALASAGYEITNIDDALRGCPILCGATSFALVIYVNKC